jgi:predicted type IV restriction endonuclease
MARLSEAKVKERIRRQLPSIAKVIEQKQQRGITEDDTATIVQAVLRRALGYDVFDHLTKEYKIKGHYADVAVRDGDSLWYFIEIKALATNLRENHLFQVVSYSVQHELPWAVLTNGDVWQCYRVAKVRGAEPFFEVTISDPNQSSQEKAELLYLLSREGFPRGLLDERWAKAQCFRPLNLARVVLSDEVMVSIRRSLKREHRGRSIDLAELREALIRGVLRGDLGEDLAKLPTTRRVRRPRKPRTARVSEREQPKSAPTSQREQGDPAP